MPWYNKATQREPEKEPIAAKDLSYAERRALYGGVLKAVLLITAVFIGGFALFLLFCTQIWLKG